MLVCFFLLLEGGTRVYRWKVGRAGSELTIDRLVPAPYVVHHAPANFTSETYQTNGQGFRNAEIDAVAASGTYRIVVLGGSAVFGLGNTSNSSTIPGFLEAMLREQHPDRPIEVINAGQPWYNSTQELVQYQTQLSDLRPDMMIVVDGYNDFFHGLRGDREPGAPAVWRSHRMEESLRLVMGQRLTLDDIRRPLAKVVLSSAFIYEILRHVPRGTQQDPFSAGPTAPPENPALVDVYVRNHRYLAAYAQADQVVFVHMFQPVVSQRPSVPSPEALYLADPYELGTLLLVERMMEAARPKLEQIAASVGGLTIDVRSVLGGGDVLFHDQVHLTDAGARRVAARLAEAVGPIITR